MPNLPRSTTGRRFGLVDSSNRRSADGADGADVDSSFILTGAAAVNEQTTNYRLQSVTLELAPTALPVPAAAWLFGSAMAGLVGMGRKRSAV